MRGRRRVKAAALSSKDQWLRLWSVAVHDLGLTDEQFYSLTPRQLDALIKRRERETEDKEFLFAQLTSYVINFSMCRPKQSVAIADFMPSQFGKIRPQPKRVRMTKAKRKAIADQLHRAFTALSGANRG